MSSHPAVNAFAIAAAYLLGVAVLSGLNLLPPLLLWLYLGFSVLTFALYALDKLRATRNWRRTPENTLHVFALLGGWPGALVAQQWLRHKSAKRSFRVVFWITVAVNVALLLLLLTRYGAWLASLLRVGGHTLHSLLAPFLPG